MKHMNGLKFPMIVVAVAMLVATIPAGAAHLSVGHSVSAAVAPAAKADLSGKWDLDVRTDSGPVAAKADFTVAKDGAITGTIESAEYGSSKISSGSVNDTSFSIKFDLSSQGSVIEVGMTGTFDEKTMKGSGSAGDSSFTFTGTRASASK